LTDLFFLHSFFRRPTPIIHPPSAAGFDRYGPFPFSAPMTADKRSNMDARIGIKASTAGRLPAARNFLWKRLHPV